MKLAIAGQRKLAAGLVLCLALAAASVAMRQQSAAPQPAPLRGQLVLEKFHSAALEHNLLGDSADRSFYVYLPPSYVRGEHRYPVLYMLHGYTGDYRWGIGVSRIVDDAIAAGTAREMIVVFPDGSNRLGGSFYADSPGSGGMEQYITRELVSYIDGRYRTLANAASRGIAGHSMGGNGALRLAIKHPDVYGATYGLSPCCIAWTDEFSLSNPAWNRALAMTSMSDFSSAPFLPRVFTAIASAWSPDAAKPPFFAALPVKLDAGALAPRPELAARWPANMPVEMVDTNLAGLKRLRAIAFDVGRQDEFASIVTGTRKFSAALKRNGIAHFFEEYEGTHGSGVAERIRTRVLPFFSEKLEFAESARAARQ